MNRKSIKKSPLRQTISYLVLRTVQPPGPGSGAAGALPGTGPLHGHGAEVPLRPGLPGAPQHGHAAGLRGEPHAGAAPAGGLRPHAVPDGPGGQLPRHGGHGGHGPPPRRYDATQDDERQQAHEAPAAAEAPGTAGVDLRPHCGASLGAQRPVDTAPCVAVVF